MPTSREISLFSADHGGANLVIFSRELHSSAAKLLLNGDEVPCDRELIPHPIKSSESQSHMLNKILLIGFDYLSSEPLPETLTGYRAYPSDEI